MNCPYRTEQIKDAAIVCKHRQRDLFVIRPLMEKLAATRSAALDFPATFEQV
jgi:hypothetical protein